MADVPKDLLQEIQRLEELFTVDQTKLKAITKHFVSELAKGKLSCNSFFRAFTNISSGLSVEGGSIVSAQLIDTILMTTLIIISP